MYYVSHVHLNELIVSYLSLSLLDFALLVYCKSWRMLKNISSFIKWTINLLYCHFAYIDSLHFLLLLPRTFLGFAVESTIFSVVLNLPESVFIKRRFRFQISAYIDFAVSGWRRWWEIRALAFTSRPIGTAVFPLCYLYFCPANHLLTGRYWSQRWWCCRYCLWAL